MFNEDEQNKNNDKDKNKSKEKNNSLTDDSDNGNRMPILDKSIGDSFLKKEMEIENIQFPDDSFLFTDLDLIGLKFDSKNKNNNLNENNRKSQKMVNIKINTLDINNIHLRNSDINPLQITIIYKLKSVNLVM